MEVKHCPELRETIFAIHNKLAELNFGVFPHESRYRTCDFPVLKDEFEILHVVQVCEDSIYYATARSTELGESSLHDYAQQDAKKEREENLPDFIEQAICEYLRIPFWMTTVPLERIAEWYASYLEIHAKAAEEKNLESSLTCLERNIQHYIDKYQDNPSALAAVVNKAREAVDKAVCS